MPWRERLHEIIFEADTAAGKAFDIALMVSIALKVRVGPPPAVNVERYRQGATVTIRNH